mmetsp:Transcript_82873/g.239750  ORF Transcript_82873/g.239750 Transcript_82873/m.239750 type:complete len:248 (+) Transcript_82873:385-1128(+)
MGAMAPGHRQVRRMTKRRLRPDDANATADNGCGGRRRWQALPFALPPPRDELITAQRPESAEESRARLPRLPRRRRRQLRPHFPRRGLRSSGELAHGAPERLRIPVGAAIVRGALVRQAQCARGGNIPLHLAKSAGDLAIQLEMGRISCHRADPIAPQVVCSRRMALGQGVVVPVRQPRRVCERATDLDAPDELPSDRLLFRHLLGVRERGSARRTVDLPRGLRALRVPFVRAPIHELLQALAAEEV